MFHISIQRCNLHTTNVVFLHILSLSINVGVSRPRIHWGSVIWMYMSGRQAGRFSLRRGKNGHFM